MAHKHVEFVKSIIHIYVHDLQQDLKIFHLSSQYTMKKKSETTVHVVSILL